MSSKFELGSSGSAAAAGADLRADGKPRVKQSDVWMKYWNLNDDGGEISCVTAVDIVKYCYSPHHQLRLYYREGKISDCTGHLKDLWLCLSASVEHKRDPAKASQMLRERTFLRPVPPPPADGHVWQPRTEPPFDMVGDRAGGK